jgi:hypothetical protein
MPQANSGSPNCQPRSPDGVTAACDGGRRRLIIRKYALGDPLDWAQDCEDELFLMNRLWNRLVEIERENRTQFYAIIARNKEVQATAGELAAITADLERLEQEMAQGGPTRETYLNRVEEVRERVAQLKKHLASVRKDAQRKARLELSALEISRRGAVKLARQQSGLWWGNYNAVVASFEQGRRTSLRRSGGELRFRHFDGSGRITNQIKRETRLSAFLEGKHSQVAIGKVPDAAWCHPSRGERRRLQRTSLTATIYTRNGGGRRTVTWPMFMHRPIPAESIIKRVVVHRRRAGLSWRWNVVFTCAESLAQPEGRTGRTVAVNLGWRRFSDEIRVATTIDNVSLQPRFVVIPGEMISGFALVERLQARRSTMRRNILRLLKSIDWSHAPATLEECARPVVTDANVRSSLIARLAVEWRSYQDWQPEFYSAVEEWRVNDRKVLLWEYNQREKLLNRRNDLFRCAVRDLFASAGTILVNHIDLGKIAQNKTYVLPLGSQRYRIISAPSILRSYIREYSERNGLTLVDATASTWECHKCGNVNKPFQARVLHQVCSHCTTRWDQDVNACLVMLTKRDQPLIPSD